MSSHREAPEISKDPQADTTDVYAFMHPTKANRVVLVCNFIPLQKPDSGPNFYEFSDDVLYEINVSNTNRGEANVTYQFFFTTKVRTESFLYNTGPISSATDPNWNRPQTVSVAKIVNGNASTVGLDLTVPPCNVGVRSTPNYADIAAGTVHDLPGGERIFAGQRGDAFHVDLGSIFDLGALRPFNAAHLISMPNTDGRNGVQGFNVHTIAIEVDASDLTKDGSQPSGSPLDRKNVIGVWSSASRRKALVWDAAKGHYRGHGPAVQVSRLANPLFNEVLVPMTRKDAWNASPPNQDSDYAQFVNQPELAKLLPVLYPGVFPNLAAYKKDRADLHAILLTGIPYGVLKDANGDKIPFMNYTGPVEADLLRLNMAVAPTAPGKESELGILGGDLAGYPNGRRLGDDVVAIELKAVAGATIPLVDPSYTPDDTAAKLNDGTTNTNSALLNDFPFIGLPGGGYEEIEPIPSASAR